MKNLKIRTQLLIGFGIMIFFVLLLGIVSVNQNNILLLQTETIYNHPLKVRRALGEIKARILTSENEIKILFLETSTEIKENCIQGFSMNKSVCDKQIDIIYDAYLGPHSDIDSLKFYIEKWSFVHENFIETIANAEKREKIEYEKHYNFASSETAQLFKALHKIDEFAKAKGDEIYLTSLELNKKMNHQLMNLILTILALSLVISYLLFINFHKPIRILTKAAQEFHRGDMSSRSDFISTNELGILSDSFNNLTESIQLKAGLDKQLVDFTSILLHEYDTRKFFQTTLNSLATHTNSQMAAIYIHKEDKSKFEYFESIGLSELAKKSFDASSFEGEFGMVLSSRKIQHIQNISEETRFVFNTVAGKYIPKEIISVPIIANNEIIAIISLASIYDYSPASLLLIDRILIALSARIEGILAYHKTTELLQKLEYANQELEIQKTELSAQSNTLKEQNVELEIQKNQLDEANRLKTNFLSNMSHELRTPLNSVIALSGVLNRRLLNKIPTEEYGYLDIIERNGKNLLALINDILDISRIEAGKEEIELSEFNISDLIKDVVSLIKPQAQQKNIELHHKESATAIQMRSDANKIRHILQNIIGNAVKFTENGKVEVFMEKDEKTIEIHICDTGIGIAENQITQIFDEFRQADASTSRKFGGTGLGLSIAKKYANFLGGNIIVSSSLGIGSEFIIQIPLEYSSERINMEEFKNETVKTAFPPDFIFDAKTNSKTILLVDDSEPAIIQLKDILEEQNYHVLPAHNGEEALSILSKTIPDAMILDLMMPEIDGFEVLETLRNVDATAHIPVLVLTSKHISKEELTFLKRNNIHQLIQKGDINRVDLQNAVMEMVIPKISTKKFYIKKDENPLKKLSVLVIEDNPDNLITVKALLSDTYTILSATDGLEGIEKAKQNIPDFILMDIALPGIDGIEAFKIIRQDPLLLHIPVIALTASAMASERETILSYGFDAYIAKPIDEFYFYKTINETLYGK